MIANELGVAVKATSGPVIEKPGDLAGMLTDLGDRQVLFIDEIHRMPATIEEILYPALEDYELDIMIVQGPSARSVKVPLQKFTLICATTRAGLLTSPLQIGGNYVIVASRGGDDHHPAWFLNLQANPAVQVAVNGQPKRAWRARVATAEERAEWWPKVTADFKNYAGYQSKTEREIPLVLLEPAG
mgnify:CR=1 FL=1